MSNTQAALLTGAIMAVGLTVAVDMAKTNLGKNIIQLSSTISFFAGIVHIVIGSKRGNISQIVVGILLFASSVGSIGLPKDLEAGAQLFLAIGGFFIKLPVD